MRLILFDIDGTLIHCGPQVRRLFAQVSEEVFGVVGDLESYDFRGRTDPQIVMDIQRSAGQTAEVVKAQLPRFKQRYLELLGRFLDRRKMRRLPAVVEVLESLAARPGLSLGLLTGNWEGGARIKLSRFDLNRFFRFGVFGDGQWHRWNMPRLALERAATVFGHRFLPSETVVVGDSRLDVACARAHGVEVIAVATGGTSVGALETAGADWVVSDLAEVGTCHPAFAA